MERTQATGKIPTEGRGDDRGAQSERATDDLSQRAPPGTGRKDGNGRGAPRTPRSLRMKILYSAIDQTVPGTKGGSVHVAAVAEGLAALGHEVTALVTPGAGEPRPSPGRWVAMRPPVGSTHPRPARAGAIARLARRVPPGAR